MAPKVSPKKKKPKAGGGAGGGETNNEGKVLVAVRIRPLYDSEGGEVAFSAAPGDAAVLDCAPPDDSAGGGDRPPRHEYNRVFGPDAPTAAVYDDVVKPIVDAVFEGFNGARCLFCCCCVFGRAWRHT